MVRQGVRGVIALIVALCSLPVLSQTANFASLNLSPGFSPSQGQVSGHTGGAYSLSSIANSDRNNDPCIGFGDPTPDHLMVLEADLPSLTIGVNTEGEDTTLLIQFPNNQILCGDDTGSKKDASITAQNWPAGTYQIWVGAFEGGQRWDYTLTAVE
ncbi:hypothetical protein BJP36_26155 [Moorena producens JHB]|uniref:Peptidase S1 n=1 Tax=Moorena producens (strain JHB) TaxID=1454205 RepID=A0A1D9G5V6_MOOP1|nr:hypothetical protein [Moorena producens]AOY82875.1 hypothetical protein BJP36_26155 [Moorena producens JHB]